MFETVFQTLFKYRPIVFGQGDLAFGAPWPLLVLLIPGGAAAVAAVWAYTGRRRALAGRDRLILLSLRGLAIAVLLFCLSGPMLVIATVVPQQNFLGILLDDSRSMQIIDRDGKARGSVALETFGPEGSELARALAERFKLRYFRFSESAERVDHAGGLTLNGSRTDLARALDQAQLELAAVPLAGLVVFTDGAHNGATSLAETLLQLRADGVPVHVVGVGTERFERDIELSRVEAPRSVLLGATVAVDLSVTQSGFERRRVRLTVEDAGRIVQAQDIELKGSGEPASVRVHFTASEAGPRQFRFSIEPQDGEVVRDNNAQELLVVVEDRRPAILYFEGEPRFEVKFLRRAVAEDENLRVVTLLRTAENKFYRLGVNDSMELAAGFPNTRHELFTYDGVILGSVEASFFTHDQLRMLADFVDQRGGGLLALGGRLALAEGGYAGTPVAEALPVVLEPAPRDGDAPYFAELTVEVTRFGRTHEVTQLGADSTTLEWAALPPLSTPHRVHEVKPGALTLLEGRAGGMSRPFVVLAYQRYGRGRAVAFPVQDSWLWQMHAGVPVEDQSHETFWRQLLRWLVAGVPDHVEVAASADRVAPGSSVTITAEVADSAYARLNGAQVVATVVAPSGVERELPMEWTVTRDGEYRTSFVPEERGRHEVRVTASRARAVVGTASSFVDVGDVGVEFFDAEMQADALRRIAEETGGRFYTPATMRTLPEDVSFTDSRATVIEERDLWDMPILFVLLVGLLSAEWGYRRRRGLP
jgi:uncharacterized membrane protein